MSRRDNSWAILPATMELWGRRKITVAELPQVWENGTVFVCRNEDGRICFIHSCGTGYGLEVGESLQCYHDQTGTSKGFYKIANILRWKKTNNEFELLSADLPFDLNTKASLAVFK